MKISVVIPAYNSAKYIARAIGSVLAQSRAAEEIIVVDDGSSDNTAEAVRSYTPKVKLICQPNSGASAARNAGIKAASGDWLAFLDADDEWLPEKLEIQVEHLQRNPQLKWTTANFFRCRCEAGHIKTADINQSQQNALQSKEQFQSYFEAHLKHAVGCTDTMLIQRQVLFEAGLFDAGVARINDIDMWLRIAYRGLPIGYIARPLAVYHLDVPESIIKAYTDGRFMADFLDRHLALAAKHNMLDDFKPCAAAMLGYWLDRMLAAGNGPQARNLLKRYGYLLSPYCRRTTYIRAIFPGIFRLYEDLKNIIIKRN